MGPRSVLLQKPTTAAFFRSGLADCLRDAISKHYHDDHEQLPLLASCMFLGLKVSSTSTCIFLSS